MSDLSLIRKLLHHCITICITLFILPSTFVTCLTLKGFRVVVCVAEHVTLKSVLNSECLPAVVALVWFSWVDELAPSHSSVLTSVNKEFGLFDKDRLTNRTLDRSHV